MSKYKQLCLIFTVLLLSLLFTHSALATYEPLRFYGALDYKVQVNDQITLFCYDEEGTRTVNFDRLTVLTNGQITIPFWGEVPIRGLTATEFKDSLNQNKPEIIVKKGVSCEVIVYHPEVKIPVIGQVRNPGYYPIGDSTVYDMIGAAGGFTFYSDESAVKVIRQRKDGTREDFFVNFPKDVYEAYEEGSGVGQDKYIVSEGDIIYVRRSKVRTFLGVMRFILQAATLGVVSGATAAALN